MSEVTIAVPPRPYPAFIEAGALRRTGERLLAVMGGARQVYVVSNPTVRKHWGPVLAESIDKAGLRF